MIIEIETHPLQPFLPENARLLMLGSFHHLVINGRWIFIIQIFKMTCGEFWLNLLPDKTYFLSKNQKHLMKNVSESS